MQGRTFFRIMFDNLFVNNAFARALSNLVNFCKEQGYYSRKELKFLNKMPLNLNKIQTKSNCDSRYIFSAKNTGVNFR